jgi:hypothetical protein
VLIGGAAGGPVGFQALVRDGGTLVTEQGRGTEWWRPLGALPRAVPLAPGDTLRGTAPAQFALDLTRGAVVFIATGREDLHIEVWENGSGGGLATGRGRRLTVRRVGQRLEVRAQ